MTITKKDIEEMNYTDFIAFLKETNRCPGGKDTVRKIFNLLNTSNNTKVLEIGSNTGFTSLEVSHITESIIDGIDISQKCIDEANLKKDLEIKSVKDRLNFQLGSAYDIPFKNDYFDILLAGGATAFMNDKNIAIDEYFRVLKDWGFACITPLVYKIKPPQEILNKVSDALGVEIKQISTDEWIEIFLKSNINWEIYYQETNAIDFVDEKTLNNYVDFFINKDHIVSLENGIKDVIKDKWLNYLNIFNENHKYLNYSIIIFRKTIYPEEMELFKIKK